MAGEDATLLGATTTTSDSDLQRQLADALARYDALPVDRKELIQRYDQLEGEIDALSGQLGVADPLAGSSGAPQDIPGELDVTDYPAPFERRPRSTQFSPEAVREHFERPFRDVEYFAKTMREGAFERPRRSIEHFAKTLKSVYDMDSGERRQLLGILLSDAQPVPAAGEAEDTGDPLVDAMSVGADFMVPFEEPYLKPGKPASDRPLYYGFTPSGPDIRESGRSDRHGRMYWQDNVRTSTGWERYEPAVHNERHPDWDYISGAVQHLEMLYGDYGRPSEVALAETESEIRRLESMLSDPKTPARVKAHLDPGGSLQEGDTLGSLRQKYIANQPPAPATSRLPREEEM